ncbi:hypothetical protein H4219_005638 [Mycoemilia scoparia]|uniref:Enoyl reductase (ER) domain-containing protein n=1 Tax=Mycoemilia scoparia TaxID=417184 RepID=A0A9W8DNX3_9FUNG|nr:hypothetical protein H4219_005638 [Mycoemilia scoparia]
MSFSDPPRPTGAYFDAYAKDPSDVKFGELPFPRKPLGPNQARVDVYVAALNPLDWKVNSGQLKYVLNTTFPAPLGYDFSGSITELPDDIHSDDGKTRNPLGLNIGDKVYGMAGITNYGTVSTSVIVNITDLARKPRNISFTKAAAIGMGGLTAYQALEKLGLTESSNNNTGDDNNNNNKSSIFISAGAGGVGSFAIQLAKHHYKLKEIATTVSTNKVEVAKKLGATTVIDYTKQDFTKDLSADYDAALDCIGVPLEVSRIIKPHNNGRIVSVIGTPTSEVLAPLADKMVSESNKIVGTTKATLLKYGIDAYHYVTVSRKLNPLGIEHHYIFVTPNGQQLEQVFNPLVVESLVNPLIDSMHEFTKEGVVAALEKVREGKTTGKVVIRVLRNLAEDIDD